MDEYQLFSSVLHEDWSIIDLQLMFTPSSNPVMACESFNILEDLAVECAHDFTVSFDSIHNCVVDPPITSASPSAVVVIADNDGMLSVVSCVTISVVNKIVCVNYIYDGCLNFARFHSGNEGSHTGSG